MKLILHEFSRRQCGSPMFILFQVLLLAGFHARAQENSASFEADTLVIIKSELLSNPFNLEDQLGSLLEKSGSQVDRTPISNLHLRDQIDTLFSVRIHKDFFQIYQNPINKILFDAEVKSKNFPVHELIEIGMKKSKLKKKLNLSYKGAIPDFVKIRDFEYMSWILLSFEKKRLSKIKYTANLD